MGFGTLFIGYFLLLNLSYYGFTDAIAAAVMLLALYKLSPLNRFFKIATFISIGFLVFALGDLGVWTYEMFWRSLNIPILHSTIASVRYMFICLISVFMLKGLEDVAKEVDLDAVPEKAARLAILSGAIFSALVLFETVAIETLAIAIISAVCLLAGFAIIIVNLSVIYSCYMKICMPGDEKGSKTKSTTSKFAFVNEYRARKAEREEEMKKEQLEILKKRADKMKGKKK